MKDYNNIIEKNKNKFKKGKDLHKWLKDTHDFPFSCSKMYSMVRNLKKKDKKEKITTKKHNNKSKPMVSTIIEVVKEHQDLNEEEIIKMVKNKLGIDKVYNYYDLDSVTFDEVENYED